MKDMAQNRAPRVRGNLKEQLLQHMTEAELKKRTASWIKKGARNEQSAHNKIANEIAGTDIGDTDIQGIYLGHYETKKQFVSMYIGQPDTSIHKLSFPNIGVFNQVVESYAPSGLAIGTPIKVNGVHHMQNVFSKAKWLEANTDSNILDSDNEEVKGVPHISILWDYAQTIGQIQESGLALVRGYIRFVNEVSDFDKDGEPGDVKPIIDSKDPTLVNLRLAIEDQGEGERPPLISVNIKTQEQLAQLINGDIDWIRTGVRKGADEKDAVMMELSDMLQNVGVVAFGRAGMEKPDGTPAKTPFLSISNFGWVQQL